MLTVGGILFFTLLLLIAKKKKNCVFFFFSDLNLELMALERPLNPTSEDADLWIKTVLNIIKVWHADILTVDLLDFFAKNIDSTGADLKALAQVLVRLKQEVEEDSVIPFKVILDKR